MGRILWQPISPSTRSLWPQQQRTTKGNWSSMFQQHVSVQISDLEAVCWPWPTVQRWAGYILSRLLINLPMGYGKLESLTTQDIVSLAIRPTDLWPMRARKKVWSMSPGYWCKRIGRNLGVVNLKELNWVSAASSSRTNRPLLPWGVCPASFSKNEPFPPPYPLILFQLHLLNEAFSDHFGMLISLFQEFPYTYFALLFSLVSLSPRSIHVTCLFTALWSASHTVQW